MTLHPQTAAHLRDAAIIFLAATVLGLGFNASSPLGVHAQAPHAAASVVGAANPYANQTVSMTTQPAGAATGGIQNETLSIAVGGAPAAAPAPVLTAKIP